MLTLDLAGAYAAAAGVQQCRSALRLERWPRGQMVLEEEYRLAAPARPSPAPHSPQRRPQRRSRPPALRRSDTPAACLLRPGLVDAAVERIPFDVARPRTVWSDGLSRIILTVCQPRPEGAWTLRMRAGCAVHDGADAIVRGGTIG